MFGVKELTFLGHQVSPQGIRPLPDKVQVIRSFPLPSTPRKLREFLGLVNYYHRFVPRCADLLAPLNNLLSACPSSTGIGWTQAAKNAFMGIKETLAEASLLVHPKEDAPVNIMTDASDQAVGAVLQQFDTVWQPIAFFSKKLSPTETRYSTFDRELLSIYLSIKHFRHVVEGRKFHILTDHKPLIYSFLSNSDRYSPRQVRHLDFISQFTTDIRHVKGDQNPAADALSRIDIQAINQLPPAIDYVAMAKAQAGDVELQNFVFHLLPVSSLRRYVFQTVVPC